MLKQKGILLITYEKIENINWHRSEELKKDLEERTELKLKDLKLNGLIFSGM